MPCLKKAKPMSRARTLQLVDLKFPFAVLGIGVGFSLLIFIFERIRVNFTDKQISKYFYSIFKY